VTNTDLVQGVLWPDGEFEPCPADKPCENCGHPMISHFRETPDFYAVACGVCMCDRWCCRHGGHRAGNGYSVKLESDSE
jgi:hypothetical protein